MRISGFFDVAETLSRHPHAAKLLKEITSTNAYPEFEKLEPDAAARSVIAAEFVKCVNDLEWNETWSRWAKDLHSDDLGNVRELYRQCVAIMAAAELARRAP
jgi:hypothetical protein